MTEWEECIAELEEAEINLRICQVEFEKALRTLLQWRLWQGRN